MRALQSLPHPVEAFTALDFLLDFCCVYVCVCVQRVSINNHPSLRYNSRFSCKEYQNLNAFFAIVMGLSNMAVSRLQQTWEKIPSKFRKLYQEFEALIDPSRNHRAYRVFVGKLQPPLIPFMPLLLKDMTFAHEGNKTSIDGLVNFEKMHMMAQTMRTLRFCRSRSLGMQFFFK